MEKRMSHSQYRAVISACLIVLIPACASAQTAGSWRDTQLSPDVRADLVVKAMTQAEKFRLVFGQFGSVQAGKFNPAPEARMGSAGYLPGIPRLGIPPQWITDAGLGVATQRDSPAPYYERTALPAGIATAATWNPDLARKGGAMIGAEARASGFNVMLGGGVNLLRDPRGGRNFEYAGEDPLLAGIMVGSAIAGIQSNHIVSTVKHYAFNDQETGRMVASADIDTAAARTSDLLAFELAIETGKPGAVMCAYNRVNAVYACENDWLLNQVLKTDWRYPGYVMSDWGAVHSTAKAALAGLDQESAYSFDSAPYFGDLLKKAVAKKLVPPSRLDDMAKRISYAMFATGLFDHPVETAPIDYGADVKVAQSDAEEAVVLLKNEGDLLPLAKTAKRVLVVGSHADKGVISGGGSSTVFPVGINAVPGIGPKGWPGPVVYLPSPPLAAIKARLPDAEVRYLEGTDRAAAAKAAATADLVVVFASQWSTEDADRSLSLPDGQDELIAALAKANSHVVVVLETGGPVFMPWLDRVSAVLEAWFPGSGGGEAIARVLFGEVDASGRLPVTFPQNRDQLPHPTLAGGAETNDKTPFSIAYDEGATVGYKWFDETGSTPRFPFGFGLSYGRYDYTDLKATVENGTLRVSFKVENVGNRTGIAVPQIYIGPKAGGWEAPRRLAGWSKVALAPGTEREVSLTVDPRLISTWDAASKQWKRTRGTLTVSLRTSAADIKASVETASPK
jgi:beta-glucosidase